MDDKLMLRIVKCVVSWNGSEIKFNRSFLEYMDNLDLKITQEEDGTIVLKTKIKKDLK